MTGRSGSGSAEVLGVVASARTIPALAKARGGRPATFGPKLSVAAAARLKPLCAASAPSRLAGA
ncbi:hypothetical protein [Paracoccus sp. SSJ]|uniref:hypothetical protein n=1 Tax=Paracoccus sp. SSJ TaxID=3050636 RepID=UPI002550CA84|nr:hypothetical protein [Paracoccus sp. SSJ]MDK8871016.1 hypothetical protein [Paracoccus sp. SSJ]